MFNLRKNDKGFTLIELLVVMAVLAILVMLAVPRYLGYTKDAEVTAMQADSKVIEQAAYQYALKNNDVWPVKIEGEPAAVVKAEITAVEDIIAKALVEKNAAANEATAATLVTTLNTNDAFVQIDDDKINPFIRSTKNPVNKYFIVDKVTVEGYENQLEGMVFYTELLVDSDGVGHSGLF